MNREQQLEQAADMIKNYKVSKAPPIFELFASLVSLSIFILLISLTGILSNHDGLFNRMMLSIMPQTAWAIFFLVGGFLSAIGMLFDSQIIRIVGLLVLSSSFGTITIFYIIVFPNLTSILMFWITIFTLASIPMVKFTGIRK